MLGERAKLALSATVLPLQSALRRRVARRVADERRGEREAERRLKEMGLASVVVQAFARRYIARGVCLTLAYQQIPRVFDPKLAPPDQAYFASDNTGRTFWSRPWVFGKRPGVNERVRSITLPGKGSEYLVLCVMCAAEPARHACEEGCDDVFCKECWDLTHRRGHRSEHLARSVDG